MKKTVFNKNCYSKLEMSPYEFISKNDLNFCEGNIIKYISRYKYKGGLSDLLKAKWYLEKLMQEFKDE